MITEPIKLTDNAITHFKRVLAKHATAQAIRFSVTEAGCVGMKYKVDCVENAQADDLAFEKEGLPLLVAAQAEPYLKGSIVDLKDKGLRQTEVVFINPNETIRCGCGESFSVDKEADE